MWRILAPDSGSKMAAAAILKKSQKSKCLRNGLTDLYEIWYADAKCAS